MSCQESVPEPEKFRVTDVVYAYTRTSKCAVSKEQQTIGRRRVQEYRRFEERLWLENRERRRFKEDSLYKEQIVTQTIVQ